MSVAAMPPNLKLVLEHLNEVRELDRYLRRKDSDGRKSRLRPHTAECVTQVLLDHVTILPRCG